MIQEIESNRDDNETWAPTIPYTSIYIDAGWSDFLFATKQCARIDSQASRDVLASKICSLFETDQNPNKAFVCLSVRTALDLFFRVQQFPAGSEVIMSAVNIPSIVDIVRHHGLAPVPWDIDPRTLAPSAERLAQLLTDRTVVVLLAHLFGKWVTVDVAPFTTLTRPRGVFFIEDCAETFLGYKYLGDPRSDMQLFSFGAIKFYTSFGGAVAKVRDETLRQRMTALYARDETARPSDYAKRLAKYRFVAYGLNSPTVIRYGIPFFRRLGVDHKSAAVNLLRGFPGDGMIRQIRRRPCAAMLASMYERLSNVDQRRFEVTKEKGELVERILTQYGVVVPGCDAQSKNYWLYPIIVKDPESFVSKINRLGVDAFTKATQLSLINCENAEHEAPMAAEMLKHFVYLPVHVNVPYSCLLEICNAVRQCINISDNFHDMQNFKVPNFKSKL